MKKFLALVTAALAITTVTACSGGSSGSESTAKDSASSKGESISILMGKSEVGSQFEKMLADYSGKNNVNVTMIPLAGQDAYEKMTSLYASGNAPTILMVGQEFGEFQEKFLDLTDTPFVKDASAGTLDFVTVDGKVYGTPTTVEAYGIIYNPDTVKGICGEDFDPTAIKTQQELKDFYKKLSDGGISPFTLSPMDWSLGAHLSNTVFAAQSEDRTQRHDFFEQLKKGEVKLIENTAFNGWVDTLDILIENNIHKDAPLAAVYEDASLELAIGDTATWFMGNWAYPELVKIEAHDYKFIPLPVSDNPEDFANGKIAVGVPSYWCVDKSNASEAQQKAAVDFLTWFITTKEGQTAYVNELNFIPAYNSFEIQPADTMSAQIAEYLSSGKTLEWMNTYYPAGGFQAMGASMQKYVDGKIDRAGLAAEWEEYWKNVK